MRPIWRDDDDAERSAGRRERDIPANMGYGAAGPVPPRVPWDQAEIGCGCWALVALLCAAAIGGCTALTLRMVYG